MSSVATLRVPASVFVLEEVLSRTSALEVWPLRSIQVDRGTMAPLLWFHGADPTSVEPWLREDPSISDPSCFFSSKNRSVYRVHLNPATDEFMRIFVDDQLSVVGAHGQDGEWALRVLAEDRDALGTLTDVWRRAGLTHTVESVVDCGDISCPTRFGLTEAQHHTLMTAFNEGYYSVPRKTNINELANRFGISHQATSQRLRRGHERLVQNTLLECSTMEFPF
ncbi:DNA-binding protein (plasmid) [Haloferax mediterranei ATCC 33500]|uniref:DNA binding domain-containing protein n=4 Tax=Haloferacaceae TaxID=1644056 RepID=I3RAL7_HALMT|nr:DNA binding domain-containing protein [Haloferax mediterranei ATCC 33500]ELZ97391.1 DNA binding domain-containing protein [Haloferax mediterranei ATCC 33500]QCQ77021.1 DNA-binding protein [Haloferax mediterranei ATCC 33500]